jgi:Domain of unknown function (DUF4389)
MDIKQIAEKFSEWIKGNLDVLLRGIIMFVYGVILYFAIFTIIWLIAIFQFVMKLITTNLNEQLLDVSESLNKYVSQILLYITFKSEERPFPFSPWPGADDAEPAKKKSSKKKAKKEASDESE